MLSKEYLKGLYESGHENLALSFAVILYSKEKSSEFYKKHKQKIKAAVSIISAYAIIQSMNYCSIINSDLETINKAKTDNEKNFSTQIDNYNQNNQDYAKEIKNMDLTDLETIMLIMNDMKNNYTYGKVSNDIYGYWRLHFDEYGQGVCASYADDFVAKINEINPNYNARCIGVWNCSSNVEWAMILNDVLFDTTDVIKERKFGNHSVVALDIKDGNYTLVVDPTNYIIVGILKNGKIYRFNKEYIYDYRFASSIVYTQETFEEYIKNIKNTFKFDDVTWRELIKIYNDEAIEEALNSAVRKRELYNSDNYN